MANVPSRLDLWCRALWRLADIGDRDIDGDFLAVTQQSQLYRLPDSHLLELIGQI